MFSCNGDKAEMVAIAILFCCALQEWKIVNNFHVRARRKNQRCGKYVSLSPIQSLTKFILLVRNTLNLENMLSTDILNYRLANV